MGDKFTFKYGSSYAISASNPNKSNYTVRNYSNPSGGRGPGAGNYGTTSPWPVHGSNNQGGCPYVGHSTLQLGMNMPQAGQTSATYDHTSSGQGVYQGRGGTLSYFQSQTGYNYQGQSHVGSNVHGQLQTRSTTHGQQIGYSFQPYTQVSSSFQISQPATGNVHCQAQTQPVLHGQPQIGSNIQTQLTPIKSSSDRGRRWHKERKNEMYDSRIHEIDYKSDRKRNVERTPSKSNDYIYEQYRERSEERNVYDRERGRDYDRYRDRDSKKSPSSRCDIGHSRDRRRGAERPPSVESDISHRRERRIGVERSPSADSDCRDRRRGTSRSPSVESDYGHDRDRRRGASKSPSNRSYYGHRRDRERRVERSPSDGSDFGHGRYGGRSAGRSPSDRSDNEHSFDRGISCGRTKSKRSDFDFIQDRRRGASRSPSDRSDSEYSLDKARSVGRTHSNRSDINHWEDEGKGSERSPLDRKDMDDIWDRGRSTERLLIGRSDSEYRFARERSTDKISLCGSATDYGQERSETAESIPLNKSHIVHSQEGSSERIRSDQRDNKNSWDERRGAEGIYQSDADLKGEERINRKDSFCNQDKSRDGEASPSDRIGFDFSSQTHKIIEGSLPDRSNFLFDQDGVRSAERRLSDESNVKTTFDRSRDRRPSNRSDIDHSHPRRSGSISSKGSESTCSNNKRDRSDSRSRQYASSHRDRYKHEVSDKPQLSGSCVKRKQQEDNWGEVKKNRHDYEQVDDILMDDEEDPEHVQSQVFIGNLPSDCTQEGLMQIIPPHFCTELWIGKHKHKGYDVCAFIKLSSMRESKKLILELKKTVYSGREIVVRFTAATDFNDYLVAKETDEDPEYFKSQVFMGNLPADITQDEVNNFLEDNTVEVEIGHHKDDQDDVCAFVRLPSMKESKMLILEKKKTVFRGREIVVRFTAAVDFMDFLVEKDEDPVHFKSQVFIGNLSLDTTKGDMEHFLHYDSVRVWIGRHKDEKDDMCAFVRLPSMKESKKLILEKKKTVFRGREIVVRFTAAVDFMDYVVIKDRGHQQHKMDIHVYKGSESSKTFSSREMKSHTTYPVVSSRAVTGSSAIPVQTAPLLTNTATSFSTTQLPTATSLFPFSVPPPPLLAPSAGVQHVPAALSAYQLQSNIPYYNNNMGMQMFSATGVQLTAAAQQPYQTTVTSYPVSAQMSAGTQSVSPRQTVPATAPIATSALQQAYPEFFTGTSLPVSCAMKRPVSGVHSIQDIPQKLGGSCKHNYHGVEIRDLPNLSTREKNQDEKKENVKYASRPDNTGDLTSDIFERLEAYKKKFEATKTSEGRKDLDALQHTEKNVGAIISSVSQEDEIKKAQIRSDSEQQDKSPVKQEYFGEQQEVLQEKLKMQRAYEEVHRNQLRLEQVKKQILDDRKKCLVNWLKKNKTKETGKRNDMEVSQKRAAVIKELEEIKLKLMKPDCEDEIYKSNFELKDEGRENKVEVSILSVETKQPRNEENQVTEGEFDVLTETEKELFDNVQIRKTKLLTHLKVNDKVGTHPLSKIDKIIQDGLKSNKFDSYILGLQYLTEIVPDSFSEKKGTGKNDFPLQLPHQFKPTNKLPYHKDSHQSQPKFSPSFHRPSCPPFPSPFLRHTGPPFPTHPFIRDPNYPNMNIPPPLPPSQNFLHSQATAIKHGQSHHPKYPDQSPTTNLNSAQNAYVCNCCEKTAYEMDIVKHLLSRKHRCKYIEIERPDVIETVRSAAGKVNYNLVDVKKLEREEGWHQVLSITEEEHKVIAKLELKLYKLKRGYDTCISLPAPSNTCHLTEEEVKVAYSKAVRFAKPVTLEEGKDWDLSEMRISSESDLKCEMDNNSESNSSSQQVYNLEVNIKSESTPPTGQCLNLEASTQSGSTPSSQQNCDLETGTMSESTPRDQQNHSLEATGIELESVTCTQQGLKPEACMKSVDMAKDPSMVCDTFIQKESTTLPTKSMDMVKDLSMVCDTLIQKESNESLIESTDMAKDSSMICNTIIQEESAESLTESTDMAKDSSMICNTIIQEESTESLTEPDTILVDVAEDTSVQYDPNTQQVYSESLAESINLVEHTSMYCDTNPQKVNPDTSIKTDRNLVNVAKSKSIYYDSCLSKVNIDTLTNSYAESPEVAEDKPMICEGNLQEEMDTSTNRLSDMKSTEDYGYKSLNYETSIQEDFLRADCGTKTEDGVRPVDNLNDSIPAESATDTKIITEGKKSFQIVKNYQKVRNDDKGEADTNSTTQSDLKLAEEAMVIKTEIKHISEESVIKDKREENIAIDLQEENIALDIQEDNIAINKQVDVATVKLAEYAAATDKWADVATDNQADGATDKQAENIAIDKQAEDVVAVKLEENATTVKLEKNVAITDKPVGNIATVKPEENVDTNKEADKDSHTENVVTDSETENESRDKQEGNLTTGKQLERESADMLEDNEAKDEKEEMEVQDKGDVIVLSNKPAEISVIKDEGFVVKDKQEELSVLDEPEEVKTDRNMEVTNEQDDTNISKSDKSPDELTEECVVLYDKLAGQNNHFIGMRYILEIQHLGIKSPPMYQCHLCDMSITLKFIASHLSGYQHRLEYLKKHFPKLYENCEGNVQEVQRFAKEIEHRFGRESIHVMKELSKDEEGISSYSEPVVVKCWYPLYNKLYNEMFTEKWVAHLTGCQETINNMVFSNVVCKSEEEQLSWKEFYSKIQEKMSAKRIVKLNRKSKLLQEYPPWGSVVFMGVQFIMEFHNTDRNILPWYICHVCEEKKLWADIRNHLTSLKHKIMYMYKCYPHKYKYLSGRNHKSVEEIASVVEGSLRGVMSMDHMYQVPEVMLELLPAKGATSTLPPAKVGTSTLHPAKAVTSTLPPAEMETSTLYPAKVGTSSLTPANVKTSKLTPIEVGTSTTPANVGTSSIPPAEVRTSTPTPAEVGTSMHTPAKAETSTLPPAEVRTSTSPANVGTSTPPPAEVGTSTLPPAEVRTSTLPQDVMGTSTLFPAEMGTSTLPPVKLGTNFDTTKQPSDNKEVVTKSSIETPAVPTISTTVLNHSIKGKQLPQLVPPAQSRGSDSLQHHQIPTLVKAPCHHKKPTRNPTASHQLRGMPPNSFSSGHLAAPVHPQSAARFVGHWMQFGQQLHHNMSSSGLMTNAMAPDYMMDRKNTDIPSAVEPGSRFSRERSNLIVINVGDKEQKTAVENTNKSNKQTKNSMECDSAKDNQLLLSENTDLGKDNELQGSEEIHIDELKNTNLKRKSNEIEQTSVELKRIKMKPGIRSRSTNLDSALTTVVSVDIPFKSHQGEEAVNSDFEETSADKNSSAKIPSIDSDVGALVSVELASENVDTKKNEFDIFVKIVDKADENKVDKTNDKEIQSTIEEAHVTVADTSLSGDENKIAAVSISLTDDGNKTEGAGTSLTSDENETAVTGFCLTGDGNETAAAGISLTCEGNKTAATGTSLICDGNKPAASGTSLTCEGNKTAVDDNSLTCDGNKAAAAGTSLTCEENKTAVDDNCLTCDGNKTAAAGTSLTCEGNKTAVDDNSLTCDGNKTVAAGTSLTCEGNKTAVDDSSLTGEGNKTAEKVAHPLRQARLGGGRVTRRSLRSNVNVLESFDHEIDPAEETVVKQKTAGSYKKSTKTITNETKPHPVEGTANMEDDKMGVTDVAMEEMEVKDVAMDAPVNDNDTVEQADVVEVDTEAMEVTSQGTIRRPKRNKRANLYQKKTDENMDVYIGYRMKMTSGTLFTEERITLQEIVSGIGIKH